MLAQNLNYSKTINRIGRQYYSNADWIELIHNDIATSGPVFLDGYTDNGGHAFVADGYDGNGMFHINWGWADMSNGYFRLDNLNPVQQGAGSSEGGYNSGLDANIGIKRPDVADKQGVVFGISSAFIPTPSQYGTGTGTAIGTGTGTGTSTGASQKNVVFYNGIVFTAASVDFTSGIRLISESTGEETYLWTDSEYKGLTWGDIFRITIDRTMFPASVSYTSNPQLNF